MKVTKAQFEQAFTNWETGFRNNPEEFNTREEIEANPPETYGESAANYFTELLADIGVEVG